MPAPHALYSKMLAERTASRKFFFFLFFLFFELDVHAFMTSRLLSVFFYPRNV